MNFIDLCCGIGGFHQALSSLGMNCVLACDIDKDCRENYELNYKIKPFDNVNHLKIEEIPSFDILCAGFPCQPFSKAGYQNGFKDDRGHLFFSICKIINYHKPKYIILENVRNLASHDNGKTWNIIKSSIQNMNYHTYDSPLILNTLQFNIPQYRERVVILCKRKDIGELQPIPFFKLDKKIQNTLPNIIENHFDNKYKLNPKLQATEQIWDTFLKILRENNIQIPKFPIWTDWWDSDGESTEITKYNLKLSEQTNKEIIKQKQFDFYNKYKNWIDKNRNFYQMNKTLLQNWLETSRLHPYWKGSLRKLEWQCDSNDKDMSMVLWSTRSSGIRIKNIDYTPTLVAMTSMIPIYGPLHRPLTPRECARLQSFSENYIIHPDDKVAYKQFGNAVNVKMIENCARFLIYNESLFV
jgi:DNA (cytosine-5)-methyltransferase 1